MGNRNPVCTLRRWLLGPRLPRAVALQPAPSRAWQHQRVSDPVVLASGTGICAAVTWDSGPCFEGEGVTSG